METPLTLDWLLENPWITVTSDCTGAWCGAGNTSEVCRFCGCVRDKRPREQEEYDKYGHEDDCPRSWRNKNSQPMQKHEDENIRLREALEHYANERKWTCADYEYGRRDRESERKDLFQSSHGPAKAQAALAGAEPQTTEG